MKYYLWGSVTTSLFLMCMSLKVMLLAEKIFNWLNKIHNIQFTRGAAGLIIWILGSHRYQLFLIYYF